MSFTVDFFGHLSSLSPIWHQLELLDPGQNYCYIQFALHVNWRQNWKSAKSGSSESFYPWQWASRCFCLFTYSFFFYSLLLWHFFSKVFSSVSPTFFFFFVSRINEVLRILFTRNSKLLYFVWNYLFLRNSIFQLYWKQKKKIKNGQSYNYTLNEWQKWLLKKSIPVKHRVFSEFFHSWVWY